MLRSSQNTNPVRAPVTVCVVVATAASLLALVLNRRHKNGPLVVVSSPTTVRSFSIACLSSLRIILALSAIRLSDAAPSMARDPTLVMFQMFTGATACLLLSSFAAAVADCWYPVGSCQYQMLAWDTLGLLFYFALPITILVLKAWAMYDVTGLLVSAGFVGGDPYSIVNGLATAVVCIVAVGVPIVNRWSILCSNWFAKVSGGQAQHHHAGEHLLLSNSLTTPSVTVLHARSAQHREGCYHRRLRRPRRARERLRRISHQPVGLAEEARGPPHDLRDA